MPTQEEFDALLRSINAGLTALAQEPAPTLVEEQLPLLAPLDSVTWKTAEIQPPSPLYLSRDDGLRVNVFNNHVGMEVEFAGRFLRSDGVVQHLREVLIPDASGQVNSFDIGVAEGFLLNASLHAHVTFLRRGVTYAALTMTQGSGVALVETTTLIADYLTAESPRSWPPGVFRSPSEGVGNVRVVDYAAQLPAQIVQVGAAVPSLWIPRYVNVVVVTDATVGNRQLSARYFINGVLSNQWFGQSSMPATTTASFWLSQWGASQVPVGASFFELLPALPALLSTDALYFGIRGAAEGDQITAASAVIEEWVQA